MTVLVRGDRPHDDDLARLRSQVAELEALHRERRAAVDQAQADVAAFKIRYRQEVGLLHDELDRLELALAEAELGELSQRVATAGPEAAPAGPSARTSAAIYDRRRPQVFRDVAKAIHPDLARDELTRDRRHSLMIEANRAYAMGDEEQLRSILEAWERSPEAVQGADAEAMRSRLVRRLAQLEEHLELLAGDLAALQDSPMWRLKAMVDEEAAKGKDLVTDMVRRLKRDILIATNRLDAIRS